MLQCTGRPFNLLQVHYISILMKPQPPDIVIGRLPMYLRALEAMLADDIDITSSYALGKRLGISSAQIRKDLSHFGDFGKQGTGYDIRYLVEQLRIILQLNQEWEVVVIGAGHVGQALVYYPGFADSGFKIVGMFDVDPEKIGEEHNGIKVQALNDMVPIIKRDGIRIAMITTPADAAQEIAESLIDAGIISILSYAPLPLNVPDDIHVQYVDPISKLQHMTYYLNREDD